MYIKVMLQHVYTSQAYDNRMRQKFRIKLIGTQKPLDRSK